MNTSEFRNLLQNYWDWVDFEVSYTSELRVGPLNAYSHYASLRTRPPLCTVSSSRPPPSYVSSPVPSWSSWETFHVSFHLSYSRCWQEWDMGMRLVRNKYL